MCEIRQDHKYAEHTQGQELRSGEGNSCENAEVVGDDADNYAG